MSKKAARHGDDALCYHERWGIDAAPTKGVMINGVNAARIGCKVCPVASSRLVTGAATVQINGQPAPRDQERTTDGGTIFEGSRNVLIGGPSAGGRLGNTEEQTAACEAAHSGRPLKSPQQSWGNCGLEAWRNTINTRRQAQGLPPLTEAQLMQQALANGWATNNPGAHNHGASGAASRVDMLRAHGIDASNKDQDPAAIQEAVAEGKGVSTHVHPYWWGPQVQPTPGDPGSWAHEVAVTGIEYDENGEVVAYWINDTGAGTCGQRLDKTTFEQSIEPKGKMTVSDKPTW